MTALGESNRLRALAETGLLGGEPDEAFDRLTRVTTALLEVPVSLVSFVEPERQFFVSCIGLPEPWQSSRETPLSHSFCQHCVVAAAPFVVDDARLHPLVRENRAVEELGVVAYAGVPIKSSDGVVLGTLCAIDSKPRAWTEEDVSLLSDLAAAAMSELERRTLIRELARRGRKPKDTNHDESDEGPGLNIAAVARRTGVPAATLRKWEQRYGVPEPLRTAGKQRRYSEIEIARVDWLKARLVEGYRISAAASILRGGGALSSPGQTAEGIVAAARRGDEKAVAEAVHQALVDAPVERVVQDVLAPALARLARSSP